MANNWENHLFTEELKRLRSEYSRCDNQEIKREVYKDIKLLQRALDQLNSYQSI